MRNDFDANSLPRPQVPNNEVSDLVGALRTLSAVSNSATAMGSRAALAGLAGITFQGSRDLYKALGYDKVLLPSRCRARFQRNGIARRVVEAYPKATWRGGAELWENDDPKTQTEFETAFEALNRRVNVWTSLQRLDILAGISQFGILIIGAKGDMPSELPSMRSQEDVLYLSAYAQDEVSITELDSDTASPRYGLPTKYQVRRSSLLSSSKGPSSFDVHWTRVIHAADNVLDDRVFGSSRLEPVWNWIDDLEKVVGGGSEAFWKRVDQGSILKIDPGIKAGVEEIKKVKEQAQDFIHGFERFLMLRGSELEQLGSDVSSFSGQVTSLLSLISGATGIPQRLLLGSERGELASEQDRENWDERVQTRRHDTGEPLLREFVGRLQEHGALPQTPNDYEIKWPQSDQMGLMEKMQVAGLAADLNTKAKGLVIKADEIRARILEMEPLSEQELAEYQAQNAPPEVPPVGEVPPGQEAQPGKPVPPPAKVANPKAPETRAAGDAPGHEFHGNQYSDVGGGNLMIGGKPVVLPRGAVGVFSHVGQGATLHAPECQHAEPRKGEKFPATQDEINDLEDRGWPIRIANCVSSNRNAAAKSVLDAADEHVGALSAVVAKARKAARETIDNEQLRSAAEARATERVQRIAEGAVLRFEEVLRDEASRVLSAAFLGGARVALGAFARVPRRASSLRAAKPGPVAGSLDLPFREAERWAAQYAARMVTEVSTTTKAAIRDVITRGFSEGYAPREAARMIRDSVGLTTAQAIAQEKFRRELENGDPGDDVWAGDREVHIPDDGGTDEWVERQAERYGDELLRYRALNIARTETLTAANAGQSALWDSAIEKGYLLGDEQREWITTPDDRLCEACLAMDGAVAGLKDDFEVPEEFADKYDPVPHPPLHPQCRCAQGLHEPEEEAQALDQEEEV